MWGPLGRRQDGSLRRRALARGVVVIAVIGLAVAAVGGGASGQTTPPGTATGGTASNPTAPQRAVRVGIVLIDPFAIKQGTSYSGFSIDLWQHIATANNYLTQYVELPNVQRLLEAVRANEIDVALTGLTITAGRAEQVEFTEPVLNSGLQVMVKTGQANAITGLIDAVTDEAVVVLLLVMLAVVLLAAFVIWMLERKSNPDFAGRARKGVEEGTWWAAVTMFSVGYGDRVPRSGFGRAFTILWMGVGMLLVAAVTATFTANLTVHRLDTDINSPDDLRDHRVVTVKDSTAAAYLKGRNISAHLVDTTDQMVDAVRNGTDEAAVYDAPVIARAVHQSAGNLAFATPQFTHSYDAIALAKGSPLREPINHALLVITDDGVYDQIYQAWFAV